MQISLFPALVSGGNVRTLDLNTIPPCTTLLSTKAHCITIGYAPTNSTYYTIMKILAEQHHLSIATDVSNATDQTYDVVGFDSQDKIETYAKTYPNATQACKQYYSRSRPNFLCVQLWSSHLPRATVFIIKIDGSISFSLKPSTMQISHHKFKSLWIKPSVSPSQFALFWTSPILYFGPVTWKLRQVENDESAEYKLSVQRHLNKATGDYMAKRGNFFGVVNGQYLIGS